MSARDRLAELFAERDEARRQGADRFHNHDTDLCMLCHAYGEDKRSLFIDCFYAVDEVVPEALDIAEVEGRQGYYLRICKSCRAALLGRLREWRDERVARRDIPKDHDGEDEDWDAEADIPVRINGAVVMLTREQFDEYQAKRAAERRTA